MMKDPSTTRQPGRVRITRRPDDEPATTGGSRAGRLLARLGQVVQGTAGHGQAGGRPARRYPRASMASGLSAAVLGAVMILQPGKGKHDTTAQIPPAPAQTTRRLKRKQPRPTSCLSTSSSSTPKADNPAPASGEKHRRRCHRNRTAGSSWWSGHRCRQGPGQFAGKDQGPLAEVNAEPRPAPDKKGNAPALPAIEPVKLTAGEGLVALPPVGEPLAAPGEKNDPGQVVDLVLRLRPPRALAAHGAGRGRCETGHTPDTAHATAPSIAPVSAPAARTQRRVQLQRPFPTSRRQLLPPDR